MNVLMQGRKNFWTLPGGDTIQLEKTCKELKKLGVNVDISIELEPDLTDYDIVHLSNLTRIQETYIQMKNAVKQNKPIVLSTIYWPMEEFEKKAQIGVRKVMNSFISMEYIEKVKAIARYFTDKNARNKATKKLIFGSFYKMQEEIVANVNYFLPNSEIEMEKLQENLKFRSENYQVIPNGVDSSIVYAKEKSSTERYKKYEDAIICVGRLDTRKNQLNLVKALDGLGYKLVLVGMVSKNHKNYFEKINKIIKRNKCFTHIEYIDNDEIYELYKVCKVSALPSWLDTPGLVNLEAGVMGCNLVLSNRGSTEEYFGEMAEYCEPDDLESIRDAVKRACNKSKSEDLKNYILQNYTWEKAAIETLKVYKKILGEE